MHDLPTGDQEHTYQCTGFAALPQPLLEVIILSSTSKQDKKALRQTCKFFQKELDDKLIGTKLTINKKTPLNIFENFLRRMQHVNGFSTINLQITDLGRRFTKLFKHLPEHLTTLVICTSGNYNNLKELRGLRCLRTLRFIGDTRICNGLEHISGLTRLECHRPRGSLAHLAPTMKHLSIAYCDLLGTSMQHFTNLEILETQQSTLTKSFQLDRQTSLQHMIVHHVWFYWYRDWRSAPMTLTRLTLHSPWAPGPLPTSITHLQILNVRGSSPYSIDYCGECLGERATCLPRLVRLDVHLAGLYDWLDAQEVFKNFRYPASFTSLQTLSLCIEVNRSSSNIETILSKLPTVSAALDSGIKLEVVTHVTDLLCGLASHSASTSVWDTFDYLATPSTCGKP